RATAAGRDPSDLVIFTMMTVITDTTPKAARDKYQDYLGYVSEEGALALMSGWTGLDFGTMAPNEVVRFTNKANAQTSALEAFTTADPDREWTVREIARHAAIGGRGPVVIGSAEEVAEELRAWVEETDVDGFNLAYALTPGTFADMADLVVPELQSRGLFKHGYAPGTFRDKLFGRGPRLPATHPAAAVRVAR
ncbi:MAG: long-chain alkane monooxygenase, partial [Acetobacteraceae bacterium]|nr:long-chain alkane monooxygenase [Acetobacteraceae bacterium]